MFSRWIVESGVSRGQRTSLRPSFSATLAARWIKFDIAPDAIVPNVPIEQGQMTEPSPFAEPLAYGACQSRSSCSVTASRTGSVRRASVSSAERRAAPSSSGATTSSPAREAQRPISQPAAASDSSNRAAYGAPEAPVIPRKTRTTALLRTLGRLEEDRELVQVLVAERREGRHRRPGIDAARALEVVDLELDALVLRSLLGEVWRAEVRGAGAEVAVARHAARLREQLRAGHGLLVALEALLLRPARDRREHLGRDRLLRGRALVGEDAHREHRQRGRHHGDGPARKPALAAEVDEGEPEQQD